MMSEKTLNLIKESEARWVDLRFTDTKGKEQHVSIPVSAWKQLQTGTRENREEETKGRKRF
jgi:glutamine synthetase